MRNDGMGRLPAGPRPWQANAAARDRVGAGIEALLRADPRLRVVDWPLQVGWDERGLWCALRRGELELRSSARWERVGTAFAADIVDELVEMLHALAWLYRDVDETGRLCLRLWKGPQGALLRRRGAEAAPVRAVLEPGCRSGEAVGDRVASIHRLGQRRAIPVAEAIARGWMRLEPAPA
jgi:hypothetical protein